MILHSDTKIQWLIRQVRSKATWKHLRGLVRQSSRAGAAARFDGRFHSFVHSDVYSRAPLIGIVREFPFRNDEFVTFVSRFFGIACGACAGITGTELKRGANTNFHVTVDPEGLALITAANGLGGLRTSYRGVTSLP